MESWDSFISAPGAVIDAARKGPVQISRHRKLFAIVRRASGGEGYLSVSEVQVRRRDVVASVLDGRVVRIGRYGTIEAVIEPVRR